MPYLEEFAEENFSGFEGDYDAYTGEGDDFLDFNGHANSFANEVSTQRVYTMVIANTTANVVTVDLFPGYKETDITPVVDGVLSKIDSSYAKTELAGVTVSGSPAPIEDFKQFLRLVPSTLNILRVSSTNAQQTQQTLTIEELSPFKKLGTREVYLGSYASENTFKDNMVTVPLPDVIVGPETKISLPILGESTVTLTLFFGATLSTSAGLRNKKKKAVASISAVGVGKVLKNQAVRKGLPGLPK